MADSSRLDEPEKVEYQEIDDSVPVNDAAQDCPNDQPNSTVQAQLPLRPVPHAVSNGTRAWDITEKFTQACSVLNIGQLVKDEYFTLFESIGALEIMDSKMDSGFLHPGETLEDDYDVLKPLLPEEVIGIMDQLLCYEMAWHQGYPLSQTLFTSVYIDKLLWPEPRTLQEAQFYRGDEPQHLGVLHHVLRAYCIGIIKCCDFVIGRITSRDYFEEEDFCTHTYNRVLFSSVPYDFVLHELEMATQFVETETESLTNAGVKSALLARLDFRRSFLMALSPDYSVQDLDRYWPPVSATLPEIETTHDLGRPVHGSFSTKIQRRLASTVPPRPVVELEFKDAFEKLSQLCADCTEAVRYTLIDPCPLEYQSFLWAFATRKPQPLAYARSYLSGFVFAGGNEVFAHLIREDLKALVFPDDQVLDPVNWTIEEPRNPMVPKDRRLQMASLIDEFTNRAMQNYLEFWTSLCQNGCRMRRMLCHSILAFDQLQSDAGVLDDDLQALTSDPQQYPLITWVYHHKLRQIEWVIQLGFEQEIYLPDELAAQYHFLSKVSETRQRLLATLLSAFEQRHSALASLSSTPELSKQIDRLKTSHALLSSLHASATGTMELATSLRQFYILLSYCRLLPTPPRPFSTPALRYELRMKPFLPLSPSEVIPFADMDAILQPCGSYTAPMADLTRMLWSADVWQELEKGIKRAREAWAVVKRMGPEAARARGVQGDWGKGVQGVLASCIAAGVAVAGAREAVEKAIEGETGAGVVGRVRERAKVEVPAASGEAGRGKRYHEWWVVPKIVKA
ncbi:Mak10-domain-containing protein [Lepidopterella palustris CBS 459.81]|uniref:Mak10-domain-containing protein n=1 Tax=Lepidopterella palustris CBS 459.81 TaxID=1314670 RepID=A0A8E2EIG0_9PEZI|nr:Mak10-domain-containing protein [Lepidopterella palustris CBS 459.81]